jgi:nucleotide-binding universal stress UspA family protein
MRKILFPVVNERDTAWGIAFLERLRQREPIEVELLSVQQPYTGHVRMFFDKDEVHTFHLEDARRELAPVKAALDRAGIPSNTHVAVGHSAAAIADFAKSRGISQIVLGPTPGRGLTGLVLGSLTRQVRSLMESAGTPCEVL